MIKYHKRRPNILVEVMRPNYNSTTFNPGNFIAHFVSTQFKPYSDKVSDALTSYNFTESLNSAEGNFNLVLTLEKDSEGRTWLDKLRIRDLVLIIEFDKIRYCGYIESIRLSAKMSTGGKPDRRILVSGGNMGKMLASFKLIMDKFLYIGTAFAEDASNELKARLAEENAKGSRIFDILKPIYESFMKLTLKMGLTNPQGKGLKAILDYYIDYESEFSKELLIRYPIALTLYQVGENSIWDIWSALVHPPLNELFGRWHSSREKFQLVFRETPFDSGNWRNLKKNVIPPQIVTSYDIGKSDQEVFTFYASTMPGQLTWKEALGIDGNSVYMDEVKWSKYGYRPLIVTNRYYNRDKVEGISTDEVIQEMRKISMKMWNWFFANDELCSGTLEIMTIDPKEWRGSKEYEGLQNPRVGEKIGLLKGEFYIEEADHSWSYKGPMITKLSLSRGYKYNPDGTMDNPIYGAEKRMITEFGGYEIEK